MYSVCNFLRNCHCLPWWLCIFFFNLAPFTFPPTVNKGSSFFTSLPTSYFLFFFFCFVVFHQVLYHCNVDMFPRLVILRLYQVLFGHLCIIFFGETYVQVFWPPPPFFFAMLCVSCKIFVPQAGIKPVPPALGARNVNPWMDRQIFSFAHFKIVFYF